MEYSGWVMFGWLIIGLIANAVWSNISDNKHFSIEFWLGYSILGLFVLFIM